MKKGDLVRLKNQRTRKLMEQWAIGKMLIVVSSSPTGIFTTVRTVGNLREIGYLKSKKLEVVNENR